MWLKIGIAQQCLMEVSTMFNRSLAQII